MADRLATILGYERETFGQRRASDSAGSAPPDGVPIRSVHSEGRHEASEKGNHALTFPDSVQTAVRQRAGGTCECSRNTCSHYGPCKLPGTEFHHKKPLSAGGDDDVTNCHLLCQACHLEAHEASNPLGRL